jgi:Ca-activated chloride channel family protein
MRFLRWDLWWMPLVILVTVLAVRRFTRRRAIAVTSAALLRDPLYRASAVRHLPTALAAVALAGVLCGLLQPVLALVEREVRIQGLDIVLVIDLSLSMTQPIGISERLRTHPSQTGPPRIEAVKQALRAFIQRRPSDRFGVVVFSDNSYVVSPLTVDHEHLLGYFNLIDPHSLIGEGRTAMGDGIAAGMQLLRRQSTSERRNKVLMVFTDGASNLGRDPMLSLNEAVRTGTRVHMIGVDLEEERKQTPKVDEFIDALRSRGGHYYAAESLSDLDEAARSLDELEQGDVRTNVYVRNEPLVAWFALPSLAMLLLAIALRAVPAFIGLH